MTRDDVNLFKARGIAILAAKITPLVRSGGYSITEAECLVEIALRHAFNQGLLAACNTTDQIRPYDDVRRVSKVIMTDLIEESSLGWIGPKPF